VSTVEPKTGANEPEKKPVPADPAKPGATPSPEKPAAQVPPTSPAPGAPTDPAWPADKPAAPGAPSPLSKPLGPVGSTGPAATAKPPLGARPAGRPGSAAFKKYKFAVMGGAFLVIGLVSWGGISLFRHFSGGDEEKKSGKRGEGGSQEAVAVNVLEVKQDRFQDTLVAVGTVAGGSEIPLRFEVDGPIDYFDFREGDKVRKGEIISRLNQRDAYLKMKRAELELDQYEKLYAIGGVARGRLEEARLAADLARSDLEKTVLRAPRDGILGDKDAEVGEFVTPNKKIATLVNIETVVVRVGIIEKEIDKVFPGQKVMLTVDTYPGVEFTGRVENISPLVQGTSKTLTVEARLDNEGGLLLPGMFARTRIVIFEEDNTIVVPNDSLEKTQAGFRLFVVTKENKAEARDVEVGYVSSQFSQITKGLSPGELVVTQKPQDLKAGSPVKIIEVQK
jgi:membrane fusion protein, multidrug efflux system